MANFRHAWRGSRGEQRGLGSRHRRFVQIHRRWLETVGHLEGMALVRDRPRAHRGERFEMGRNSAPRWKIASRRSEPRVSAASEEWTKQEDGPPKPANERRVRLVLDDRR